MSIAIASTIMQLNLPEISNWKSKFNTMGKFSVFGLRKPGTSVSNPKQKQTQHHYNKMYVSYTVY